MKPVATALLACLTLVAHAQQPLCSSDTGPAPRAVLERFTSADCAACWQAADADPPSPEGTVLLDWVVPTVAGANAPLAMGARRDALDRLLALGLRPPDTVEQRALPVRAKPGLHLRVAHGLAVANYVGTGLELSPPDPGPWTAVLLLVERMRTEMSARSPERHLVRNMLVIDWHDPRRSVDTVLGAWRESRPMSIPEDALFENLYALAWVQDTEGHTVALARAACTKID